MITITLGASAYIDVAEYLRAATNVEAASLLGLNTVIGGATTVAAGTTALPVAAAGWAAGPLWLLDGPYSECVQVTGAPDGTHVTLAAPGTLFAHSPRHYCKPAPASRTTAARALRLGIALFATSRTERWGMPGNRAWLDRDRVLCLRPGHFPIQSVAALSVEGAPGQALHLDVTQTEVASSGRMIEIPLAAGLLLSGQVIFPVTGVSRRRRQWVVATYTGGIAIGAMPYDVRQACIWVTSEMLGQRRNPTGAALVRQDKFELQARPWGDHTGDSTLLLQAQAALEPYRDEPSTCRRHQLPCPASS